MPGAINKLPYTFGRYTLLERMGIGGMAEVFRAEQGGAAGFSKEVVVKRILPHLAEDPRFVEMFLREAGLAAGINHPNVVQVFDAGEVDGSYYIAMECVNGITVRALARRLWRANEELPLEVACGLIADAALGLEVIHSATDPLGKALDIVHRDISPDNLMVTLEGTTKILDFGIARSKDTKRLTRTGELRGKIPYMPPEQIESRPLDGTTDLYALGISLYWLLTRTRPFDRASDLSTLNAIVTQKPPPPRTRNPDIPPALEVLILQLLHKDPKRRPASGRVVHDRIMRAVPGAHVPEALLRHAMSLPSARYADLDESEAPVDLPDTVPATAADTVPLSVVSAEALAELEEPSTRTLADAGVMPPPRSRRAAAVVVALVAGGALAAGLFFALREDPARGVAPPLLVAAPPVDAGLPPARVDAGAPVAEGQRQVPVVVAKPRQRRTRSWSVKGPSAVRWLYRGRTVGRGNATLKLPGHVRQIVAYDSVRRVKTTVSLKQGLDYKGLPKGKIAFRVHPFATVSLGSKKIGTTPFPNLVVTAGDYEAIKLVGPHSKVTRKLTVRPGAVATLKADLSK